MRLAAVWLVFVTLFVTGPEPWGRQAFHNRSAVGEDARLIDRVRGRAGQALDVGQPDDAAALLQGMVLGDDSHLSKKVRDEFRRASLTHVVAASGQNVSLMLGLALPVLAAFGLARKARLLVGAAMVALYVPLAGGEAPIRRAAVMALVLLAGQLRGNASDAWHALGLAGTVTLLMDRTSAASLGWQLSFAAVAGMLAIGRRLAASLHRRGLPHPLAEALAMTLAATAATTPLIAWRVGSLSLVGIPANLLAGPAVAPAMWLGMLASAAGQLSSFLGVPLAWLASVPAAAVLEVAHIAASPDWASVDWRPPGLVAVLMVALIVFSGMARVRSRVAA
jgi:competence protein ComEC